MIELKENPVVYITRDLERAIGLNIDTQGYFIISNCSPFANSISAGHDNVLLIDSEDQLDTWELLKNKKAVEFVNKIPNAGILVFKNTKQIERICEENKWNLLNPPAELSNNVEEKLSQVEWLGELNKYLPETKIEKCADIEFTGKEFIIQFNRSHTGSGTILINSKDQLEEIKKKFPQRPAKVVEYIQGHVFTSNNIVTPSEIIVGNINFQITGLRPFTDNKFATIGNDWCAPNLMLSEQQRAKFQKITTEIGEKLRNDGWKGAFGIDIAVDEKSGEPYLIEINARQPASVSCESGLQDKARKNAKELTTFEAHLCALLNRDIADNDLARVGNGAQIIQRVTNNIKSLTEPKFFNNEHELRVIRYSNTKVGTDLMRIQVPYCIINKQGNLNEKGRQLINFIITIKHGKAWNVTRAGAIIMKDNKLLVIRRNRYGKKYYILPGGGLEDGDKDMMQTAVREVKEETNLDITLSNQKPIEIKIDGKEEIYYITDKFTGEASLGGEEAERNSGEDIYKIEWIDIADMDNINLLPTELKSEIMKLTDKQ